MLCSLLYIKLSSILHAHLVIVLKINMMLRKCIVIDRKQTVTAELKACLLCVLKSIQIPTAESYAIHLSPIKCFSAALVFPIKSTKDVPYLSDPVQKREAVIQTLVIEIAEQGASDPFLLFHDKNDFDKISEDVTEAKKC